MLSHEFMNFLMNQKVEKKIEDKYYLKKGLVGLLNYINAKGSTDQKVYGK
ncbi:MAG: hypothetical protein WC197_06925 [Candidatus Gastranaerophilaceae bacterium]|jgi:hypothetical protein